MGTGGESGEQGSEDTSQAEHLGGWTWRALQEKSLGAAAVCVEDSETATMRSGCSGNIFETYY